MLKIKYPKNILSFNFKPITGKQIKEWIKFHRDNITEYSKIANRMERFMTIKDDLYYYLVLRPSGSSCGSFKRYNPDVVRYDKITVEILSKE